VVQSALDLRIGSSSAIAYLPAEPAGTFLFFGGAGEETYLQIVQFGDMESEQSRWSGGRLCWEGRISVDRYILRVVLMADRVLAHYGGVEAYSKAWSGIVFPTEKLAFLRVSTI
jgi:hypothetical protein